MLSTMHRRHPDDPAFAARPLGISVDLMTIVGDGGPDVLAEWDFALIALGVTPFLLLFVSRFKGAVKRATREVRLVKATSSPCCKQGLQSMRVVKAFEQQDLERQLAVVEQERRSGGAFAPASIKSLAVAGRHRRGRGCARDRPCARRRA